MCSFLSSADSTGYKARVFQRDKAFLWSHCTFVSYFLYFSYFVLIFEFSKLISQLHVSSHRLSGGAYLGFYHMGVLKGLWSEGLLPRVISGASAGSIMTAIVG
jgi:hypothetical protein